MDFRLLLSVRSNLLHSDLHLRDVTRSKAKVIHVVYAFELSKLFSVSFFMLMLGAFSRGSLDTHHIDAI